MTKSTVIKTNLDVAKILYPDEVRLQRECMGELRRTVDVFVEANSEQGLQILATALSSLVNTTVHLASYMQVDHDTMTQMFTEVLKGTYPDVKS